MILRYTLAWLLLALVAVGNGTLRQFTYGRHMPELAAHQISTLTAIILLGLVIYGMSRAWVFQSASQAILVGLIWVVMTLAFEFLFGHYVGGHSWARLMEDYDLLAGRLWVLIPIWIGVAPSLFYSFRR